MQRSKPLRIPKFECYRNYVIEKDPNPQYRILPCEYEEDENDWV